VSTFRKVLVAIVCGELDPEVAAWRKCIYGVRMLFYPEPSSRKRDASGERLEPITTRSVSNVYTGST
jgi:hypothetical protein